MGRFLTEDTWTGDYDRPLSFNRWNYVEGNPVNLIDPSGKFPALLCQMMPNKATYELCVDQSYDIEPISYFELGASVTGEPGCYDGPTAYRAPGYIEGLGLTGTPSVVNWLFAFESVYDFATMEQQFFINDYAPGLGLSDTFWGINVSAYAGTVYGLKTEPSSISVDYPGPVFERFHGISGPPGIGFDTAGIGVGAGKTRFTSLLDPRIRGETWYISGSLSYDPLPIADLGGGVISVLDLPNRSVVSYLAPGNPNHVDAQRLYFDIVLGRNSAWPIITNPLSGGVSVDWGARMYGAYLAMKYAVVYEELH